MDKKYYEKHKEEIKKKRKEYLNRPEVRERTRERSRIYARKYRKNNKNKIKQQRNNKPRAKHKNTRKQSSAIYREAIIYYLINRDGINCGFCGKPIDIETVTIDHTVPKFLGGENRLENFRLAHKSCNCEAGGYLRRQY